MKRGDVETWKRWNEEEFVRFLGKSKGEGTTLEVFKEHSKKDNENKEEEKRQQISWELEDGGNPRSWDETMTLCVARQVVENFLL